jgi:hypothetical protein
VSLPNTGGGLIELFRDFRTLVFLQVLITSVKGDVGADEPEDKTMIVMCQLKNCWVSWAGELELL